jgi:hypothetical protein
MLKNPKGGDLGILRRTILNILLRVLVTIDGGLDW